MTMEERKERGLLWTDTPEAMEAQKIARGLAFEFNHLHPSETEKKMVLIREMFGSVGENVWIEPPMTLTFGKTVTIGEGTYINSNLTLVDDYKINIGNHVLIAPNVTICATAHPLHYKMRMHGEMYSKEVVIRDYVWIGSNAVILPGVTIGEHSVIGAGRIVPNEIPHKTLAMGVPCRVIREIDERDLVWER
ncbi:MAG: galactoside O-acetyltransferase [Clostridiales bacterium]|nr:galactoside O-acetyltransferase [Clostridiales bacterium]